MIKDLLSYITADWEANAKNAKGRIVLTLFRLASAASSAPKPIRYMLTPYAVFYRLLVEWILGIELPWRLKVGKGLRLFHGVALVVNDRAVIGENCVLRHSTTIGVKLTSSNYDGEAPIIGSNVDIGSNVVIVGAVCIGDNVSIGAGSVVIHNVPANSVVAGNPARIVKSLAVIQ